MIPLETKRFLCGECLTHFELTLEPTAGDAAMPVDLRFCPYCGLALNESNPPRTPFDPITPITGVQS